MAVAAVAVFVLVTPALAARDLKAVSPAVGAVTGAVSGLLAGGILPSGNLPFLGGATGAVTNLPVLGSATGAVSGLLAIPRELSVPTIPNLIAPSILPFLPTIPDLDGPKSLPTLSLPTRPVVGAVQSIPIAGGLIG
jgi:hypothetical protein